jgi:hypothetical protein
VPQFHKHVRPWCVENISLRKNVPFLTFNKPTVASNSVDKGDSAGDSQPQSPGAGKSQEITGEEAVEPFAGRTNASKNLKVKRRQKSCTSARAAPVDHEAPLLALAQRIPMRQVRTQSLQLCSVSFFNLRQDDRLFAELIEHISLSLGISAHLGPDCVPRQRTQHLHQVSYGAVSQGFPTMQVIPLHSRD